MKYLIMIIALLCDSLTSFANPCMSLQEKLQTAAKVTEEITDLKVRCEKYQTAKNQFNEQYLKPLITSYPRAGIEASIKKLNSTLVGYKNKISQLASQLGSLELSSQSEVGTDLSEFDGQINLLESELKIISSRELSGYFETGVKEFLDQLNKALGTPGLEDKNKQLLIRVRDKFTATERNISKKIAKFKSKSESEISLIRRTLNIKKYQWHESQFDKFRNEVSESLRETTESMYSLELVLTFLSQNQIESQIKSAQLKAAQGIYDIAIDDLNDLNRQLNEFETLNSDRIQTEAKALIALQHKGILESLTLYRSKTLEEKDKRLLKMISVVSKYIQDKTVNCSSAFNTFSSRQKLFENRKNSVLASYEKAVANDVAIARHRFAETVLLDGHHLVNLCNKAGGQ